MILSDAEIKSNILRIKGILAGRARLLAATKTVPPEKINFALDCGIDLIGENRADELLEKYDRIDTSRCEVHFIGRLQTNKVKYIIDKVSMIHSVDSVRLASEINRRAENAGRIMDILIEINLGGEASKGGISLEEADDFIAQLSDMRAINVRGLMAVPPKTEKTDGNAELFEKIYKKYVDISAKKVDNGNIDILSVGMSNDFADAVAHGSNLVRIGSAIFGKRENNNIQLNTEEQQ